MAKLSKNQIEEIKEYCSRGCELTGTQEVVDDLVIETLRECGSEFYGDEVSLYDGREFSTVQDFAEKFWDKACEKVINMVSTIE